jgi:hypothetical protein
VREEIRQFAAANGEDFSPFGIQDYGFSRADALRVLDLLEANGTPVFGGDVYSIESGEPVSTVDGWCSDRRIEEKLKEFATRSVAEARAYVSSYPATAATRFTIIAEYWLSPPPEKQTGY